MTILNGEGGRCHAGLAVVCGTVTTVNAIGQQTEAINSDASSSGKPASLYDAESASYAYGKRVTKGSAVTEPAHIRQGDRDLGQLDGGNDLPFVLAYQGGKNAQYLLKRPRNVIKNLHEGQDLQTGIAQPDRRFASLA